MDLTSPSLADLDRTAEDGSKDALSGTLDRNIQALLDRRAQNVREASLEERIADRITRFAGSMTFVYLHVAIFGFWILVNLGFLPFVPVFDPSLVILAMVASVEAIFLSTFVLISQNRMAAADDERADLNLQISLLHEHETTRLIALVSSLARKLGVDVDEDIDELKHDVLPEKVLDKIEREKGGKDGL
ncbi:DUF1003 domain-containing protein [Rhizobium sp. LC145]|uniref:DUF1003 domain-containing protein n=1 Tax=Rhizobium sp. LC145 TaxID=1120688 RepID=UPI0009E22322|nr:DUF1003 domain-containing protein [Rhizobium sp. LC145]TKT54572.1 DUF1003 domain-containing protein [Rhizobiaceae bacterium LC148]